MGKRTLTERWTPDTGWQEALRRIAKAWQEGARELSLAGLSLTSVPSEIGSLTALQRLWLNKNDFTTLPSEIGSLAALRTLWLSETPLTTLPPEIGSLTALQTLVLYHNRLTALPPEIGSLTALKVLNLQSNQLAALPSAISSLAALQELNLHSNRLITLQPEIWSLTALQELYLYGNQITTLPPEIGSLTALRKLYLGGNNFTAMPAEIGSLRALQMLWLNDNRLTELPPEIGFLTALQMLDLRSNLLTTLPPEIASLTSLLTLNLDNNNLTQLPTEIGSLTSLESLSLTNTKISTVPAEISSCRALQALCLNDNQLTTLPPEIGSLTALQTVDLSGNQLTALPPEIRQLEGSLRQLYLHGNPKLGLSREVLGSTPNEDKEGKNAAKPSVLLAAYFGARTGHAQALNEVKLLFVGHGRVGKTCLIKALRGEPFDEHEPETPGIERHRLPLKKGKTEYTAHVWDFGGQEFLHHTHQFFFSARSIYVIVLSGRIGRVDAEAEYWLRLVRTYGAGSPVVLVLNQVKAHPFDIDEHTLRERFPEIKAVLKTDANPKSGISQLKDALAKLAGEVEGVKQKIDPRWAKVRTRLETMKENFVAYDGYRTMCTNEGVTDPKEQDTLATILNCLGIALNYRDDPRLRDTSVLKPQWLVDGIYGVLRWMQKHKTKGIVQRSDLAKALPKRKLYPLDMHRYLLDLMAKFELSFQLDAAGGKCLVPGLLSPNQPVELTRFMDEKARHVQFRYSELRPPGLMPQFIVRSHTLSDGNPRWQRGVVLKRGNAEVLVRADAAQLVTDVYALGDHEDRVWLTEYVYTEMRQLNGKLPVKTFVESDVQRGVWSEWETLRAATIAKVTERAETRESGATTIVAPAAMLGEVESSEATHVGTYEPLPLFVCYAHANEKLVKELLPTLRILTNRGYILAWRDTDLVPGEDWDETIKSRLLEAEIVLYMVTQPFLASKYILEQERPISMKQHAAGKAEVLPVLLRDCDCRGEDFDKLEMLPYKGRTLDSYQPHDGGWKLVQLGIQKAVERRRAKRELGTGRTSKS